eukprot:364605-Chlamydomonas_euryale.AAC.5
MHLQFSKSVQDAPKPLSDRLSSTEPRYGGLEGVLTGRLLSEQSFGRGACRATRGAARNQQPAVWLRPSVGCAFPTHTVSDLFWLRCALRGAVQGE